MCMQSFAEKLAAEAGAKSREEKGTNSHRQVVGWWPHSTRSEAMKKVECSKQKGGGP